MSRLSQLQPGFDDSKWMVIDLPHDYSMMDLPGEDVPDQIGPFSTAGNIKLKAESEGLTTGELTIITK